MQFPSSFLPFFIFLLSIFPDLTLSARSSATSFCKCICFKNSTIIALNPPSTTSTPKHQNSLLLHRSPSPDDNDKDSSDTKKPPPAQHHKLTCADCNRAFCLDYNLPICKNAREEDVFTSCFQRDSIKDETVVILFLFTTAGLLGWALIKPWVEKLRDRGPGTGVNGGGIAAGSGTAGGYSRVSVPRSNR